MAGTPRNTTQFKGSVNLLTSEDGEAPQYCIEGVPIGSGLLDTDLGWEFFFDTSHPNEAGALAVDADTWTVIPNNKGFPLPTATNLPEGVTGFYDGVTQTLFFDEPEAKFIATLGFAIIPSTANATIQVRGLTGIGGPFYGPTTTQLAVDAGETNVFNVEIQTPSTDNLVTNGVQFEVNCSADFQIWGAAYQISKIVQKDN